MIEKKLKQVFELYQAGKFEAKTVEINGFNCISVNIDGQNHKIAVSPVINLSEIPPAYNAYTKPKKNGVTPAWMWFEGTESPIQVKVDLETGEVHDWEKNKSRLKYHSEDIDLSEYDLALPTLGPGDRWVTLKPHGPDSDSYARVVIHEHKDGSAHVVWAGNKNLEHLRLGGVAKNEQEYSTKIKAQKKVELTHEQLEQRKLAKNQQESKINESKGLLGQRVSEILNAEGIDPVAIAESLLQRSRSIPNISEERSRDKDRVQQEQKRKEKLQRILKGKSESKTGNTGESKITPEDALIESAIQELIGELPSALSSNDPALNEAWQRVKADPEKLKQIAAAKAQYDANVRDVKKFYSTGQKGSIRVENRLAFYDDSDDSELALLDEAKNRVRYQLNSKFWSTVGGTKGDNESNGLGEGARSYFIQGSTDALSALSDIVGSGHKVNPSAVVLLGSETISQAIAHMVFQRGPESVRSSIEKVSSFMESSVPQETVVSALQIAEEVDEERKKIREEGAASMLSDVARVNALKNQTIRKQKAVARAAGSLETAADLLDRLRQGPKDSVIIPSADDTNLLINRLEKAGLVNDEDFKIVRVSGNDGLEVKSDALVKLLRASDDMTEDDQEIADIKSHKANTDDFHVPGLSESINLSPSQQAAVRFFEKQEKIFGNIGVGMGKTITFGSAAARLIASGKAKRGIYIVPTNLLNGTLSELRDKFPGMNVRAAHPTLDPEAKTKDKRQKMYSKGEYDVLLIGQNTIRTDADHIAQACENQQIDFVFGDEIHSMFTPGESFNQEKQSQRSNSVMKIRAPYMFAATGTPIRRGSSEVWKVLNWIRPGEFGSITNWNLKYGKIGSGVSAFGSVVDKQFKRDINSSTITELARPSVEFQENNAEIELTPFQQQEYRRIQDEYDEMKLQPGVDRRRLLQEKIQKQRELIYAGDLENNSMLQRLHQDVGQLISDGNARGLIHCTSIAAVDSVSRSFPPGSVLKYTGETTPAERARILTALNSGAIIEGIRVKSHDNTLEGIVKEKRKDTVVIEKDNGEIVEYPLDSVDSALIGIVGTSNSVGVISTGLNAQKGANWNIHYQLSDYGSTHVQRDARTLRTGQQRNVTSLVYVPQTPTSREHFQRLQEQIAMNKSFDDPDEYDENMVLERNPEVALR
jgi:hypothetical protein